MAKEFVHKSIEADVKPDVEKSYKKTNIRAEKIYLELLQRDLNKLRVCKLEPVDCGTMLELMEQNTSLEAGEVEQGLMGYDVFQVIILFSIVFSDIVSPLGIAFNVINIIVFVKLGLHESTNITFVSLAVADICILLTLLGYSVVFNPLVLTSAPNFDIIDAVIYLILGWPNVLSTRIAGCLTAFITFERFLSVAWPLKVKTVITRSSTVLFSLGVYIFSVIYSIPMFLANNIGPRFNSNLNQTVVGMIIAEDSAILEAVSRGVNTVVEFTSFTLVIVFTFGLIQSFVQTIKWRQATSSAATSINMSTRDRKLVKMIGFSQRPVQ
ncbi:uncharacterized protein LOC131954024 [Physella acuta]|uniref:uncharacterized protein LOC131954024 n=1 Tax=Physella acuta TaxID=109671 RepID=UPI0027DAEE9A|nr:uncharacterized protein LOC131954024 [Physella acuta]